MRGTLVLLLSLLAGAPAWAQLEWRVSVKVFTGAGGALPQAPGWSGGAALYQSITNAVNAANAILNATGRGYAWRLTEIVQVPGNTTPLPASTNSWFNLAVNAATQDDLDTKAKNNPNAFAYRGNAINFYYSNNSSSQNGGYCAFPSENQHVITVAPNSFADVFIHESGHFFSLAHTFDTQAFQNSNGSNCTNGCACARLLGGDDGVPDTPLDHTCWNQNQIAQNTYGLPYASLNGAQQYFVDNTWSNIMSYHSPGNRFTSDQLDRITDTSNAARLNVTNGRTRFVDRNGSIFFALGSSTFPYVTVQQGVNNANNGDIVLMRPGTYAEPGTYTKPVTFRATRGSATLGVP
jgi:hypothetical protein